MTAPTPFVYPPAPHQRRHGPAGYNPYNGFKEWLRDEFAFRCVYCLEREVWYPDRSASFSVEHIIPQSADASLVCEYTNLVYACTRCNSARRNIPILNPCGAAFGDHICLGQKGVLIAQTSQGQDLIDLLHLNKNPALQVRRKYLLIQALKQKNPTDTDIDMLFLGEFGFPEDMPDLRTMQPPGGNKMKGSEQSCYRALKERAELPPTF